MPLVLTPFLLGGARPWFWSVIAALFFCGFVIFLWVETDLTSFRERISRRWIIVLGLFLTYPLLQFLPLPVGILSLMSPHRALWLQKVGELTRSPDWASGITYVPMITLFSWFWWLFLAGYAFFLRRTLQEEGNRDGFFLLIFIFAAFEAFYGLSQVLFPGLGVLWERGGTGKACGTFVNRNHYAAFLGMLWPVLLSYLMSFTEGFSQNTSISYTEKEHYRQLRQKQLFLSFIIGIVLLALFFSQSRGGIISALVALTVFVSFGGNRRRGMLIFVVGCWLVMFVYGNIIGFDEILARFDKIEESAPSRFRLWEDTWRLIWDHPLTGTGLGSYGTLFRIYQSHLSETFRASHAHNDYLQLAAELGLPIAIGVIGLVWGYLVYCARRIRKDMPLRSPSEKRKVPVMKRTEHGSQGIEEKVKHKYHVGSQDRERQLIAMGAVAGGAAFLCHGFLDFNWQIPANQLYFVTLLVLMEGKSAAR